ncbi:MAG: NADH-quinone oxidoreductase subunit H 2 [Candidatus Binatia bacterium]|nr:MAG: NADH-quinone oxidoreductase subunit H 2 [Candidatus Binatia bacterium]
MWLEVGLAAAKGAFVLLMVLQLAGLLGWIERKGSALVQDRIGANRAAIPLFGRPIAAAGLVNTLLADPIKFLTKEDVVPAGADRTLHTLAPAMTLFPVLLTFAVVPFGDVLRVGEYEIPLQVAPLDVGLLYVLAMVSLGVYGVVLGGWASNNRWSLLGGIRGSAQMISYELAMGLSVAAAVLVYGTLDLQEISRAQGTELAGWIPAWGILYQPLGCLVFLVAGIAESKRIPFDLPEAESELVSGYFTEYSGIKHLMFFMTDFVEIVLVSALVTTLYLGGWQVPYLGRAGFVFPWGTEILLPHLVVVLLQVGAFTLKVLFLCWLQIMIRWTLPRFRYDQLIRLGWKGLLPVSLANLVATAVFLLVLEA